MQTLAAISSVGFSIIGNEPQEQGLVTIKIYKIVERFSTYIEYKKFQISNINLHTSIGQENMGQNCS